ncbi:hypothetical protein [Mycobacterium sp.]|uniref:hypothetical protein n=1 Tax=Mycobacterium sp. TaxID=1785 RepID=UPI003F9D1D1A
MPQADDDDVATEGGYRLPAGGYVRLLRGQCEMRATIAHVDPYAVLRDDWDPAQHAEAKKLAADVAEEMFAEKLGEPIAVAQWQARGRPVPGMPPWLTASAEHGGATQVRVYPDDVCEPAAFRGERLPNGVGFEQIRVEPWHRPPIQRGRATDR